MHVTTFDNNNRTIRTISQHSVQDISQIVSRDLHFLYDQKELIDYCVKLYYIAQIIKLIANIFKVQIWKQKKTMQNIFINDQACSYH